VRVQEFFEKLGVFIVHVLDIVLGKITLFHIFS
jgi:hypothetical protein